MKAIRVHETGGPEVLRLEEVEAPEAGPDEVLIAVALAGVNYADTGVRRGMFHGPDEEGSLPMTPGFEVAGTVSALGEGVSGFGIGDRVAAVLESGGYAEYAAARAEAVVAVPEDVGFVDATALLVQGLTAYGLLHDSAGIRQGESVLVQAAAGGVGSLAVQLAKLAGAGTVIGTASTEEKRDLALALGADVAVDYTRDGWVDEVLEATGGRGVDIVLESVGGEIGRQAYAALAPLGRLVTFGAAGGGGIEAPDMWRLNMKGQGVMGYGGPWLRPGAAEAAREAITRHLQRGELRVVEGASFPLAEAAEAHAAVEGRKTTGKVVLTA